MTLPPRPQPGAPRAYEFPTVERERLPNGLAVQVAPMPRLPLVTALLLVDAGAVADPSGREGTASLAARCLAEGATLPNGTVLDGAAIATRFEGLGTAFTADADWDATVARMTVTTDRFAAALELFAAVVRAPSFPARDVARRRDERLAEIEQELAEPRGLADLRFQEALYASGARYAAPLGGSATTVAALAPGDLAAFHAARYRPERMTLILVGDVSPAEGFAMAARWFGGAAGTAGVAGAAVAADVGSAAPDLVTNSEAQRVVVDREGAPQTEIRVGHVGVPRSHPDYLPIVVMNGILGGLFSSRLNLNLRERHAFTYGASSAFDWRRAAGPFVVSTAVKTEVTARAIAEILHEIAALRAAPPTVEEVSLATDYLAGVFPIRFETTDAVASALAGATMFGLDDAWFRAYRDRIRAVTATDVHRVARERLHAERLTVLLVGDARTLAQQEAPAAAPRDEDPR